MARRFCGGGTSSLAPLPPAQMAHVAPWIADAFGYSFWFVVGAILIGLIPCWPCCRAGRPTWLRPAQRCQPGPRADTRGVPDTRSCRGRDARSGVLSGQEAEA